MTPGEDRERKLRAIMGGKYKAPRERIDTLAPGIEERLKEVLKDRYKRPRPFRVKTCRCIDHLCKCNKRTVESSKKGDAR